MSTCSIVIINWNSWEQVKKQLQVIQDDRFFEVHVVDNGSTESCPFSPSAFSDVSFHMLKRNTGFSHACNFGFTKSASPWIVFLNPDVSIAPDEIKKWIVETENRGLVASSPNSEDDRYAKPLPSFWSLLVEFSPLHRFFKYKSEVQTLIGGALLIKSQIFEKIGGYDERFFLWFEDSDLTRRLANEGLSFGRINLVWSHIGGQTFEKMEKKSRREVFFHSLDVYIRKHFNLFSAILLEMVLHRFHTPRLLSADEQGVTLVIPNMDPDLLARFFERNGMVLEKTTECIVVSSGLSVELLWKYRRLYPEVRCITIASNRGFAHTVNIGFRVARTCVIGTQNDDVESDGSWIDRCVPLLDEKTAAVNPIIHSTKREVESAGIQVLPRGKAKPLKIAPEDGVVDATNAAAVLYSHQALSKVGLFDERFGSYLEDIDLSLRLKRNGFTNRVCSETSVIHVGQSTSKKMKWRKNWLDLKNWTLVVLKNDSLSELVFHAPTIFIERLRNMSGLLRALLS